MIPQERFAPPPRHTRKGLDPSSLFKGRLNGLLALSDDGTDPETPILIGGRWNGHRLDLAAMEEMVATYNPAAQPAPIKLTHAKDQKTAYGWVKALRLGEWTPPGMAKAVKTLFAKLELTADGRSAVEGGGYRMKSIEAWPRNHPSNPTPGRWNFRALALLGSESPGCPNLSPLQLSAEDPEPETPVLILQADTTPTPGDDPSPSPQGGSMTPEEKAQLDQANAKNKELLAQLAAQKLASDTTALKTKLDGLVQAKKITPAQSAILLPVLLSLPEEGAVKLAEGKEVAPREALLSALDANGELKIFKRPDVPGDAPAELASDDQKAKTKAFGDMVEKFKKEGKSHAEAVACAAKEMDKPSC